MTRTPQRQRVPKVVRPPLNELRKFADKRTKRPKKGVVNRNILIDTRIGHNDYIFHATKGWRKRRVF